MFSLGLNELLIVVFVAVLVIAPSDMPKVMKSLGKLLARFRMFTRDINGQVNSFIDDALLDEEVEDEKESD